MVTMFTVCAIVGSAILVLQFMLTLFGLDHENALMGFSMLVLVSKRYKRCPSNRILVIYGKVRTGQSARSTRGPRRRRRPGEDG